MNVRQAALFASVAIAAWLAFFGDKTPASEIAEPASRPESAAVAVAGAPGMTPKPLQTSATVLAASAERAAGERAGERAPVILALQERDTLIRDGRNAQQLDTLFNSQSWTPAPPAPPKMKKLPPPPPVAPPLTLTYLGKKLEDGVWEVYLGRAEKTFIVRAQSVIEGNYRVDSIIPPTLSLTYLPLKQVQRLTIGGTD